jgi:hypothetical protein
VKYTPAELASADQNVAAITAELAAIVETERGADHSVAGIDELAHAILQELDPNACAVALSIAIHQLAQVKP